MDKKKKKNHVYFVQYIFSAIKSIFTIFTIQSFSFLFFSIHSTIFFFFSFKKNVFFCWCNLKISYFKKHGRQNMIGNKREVSCLAQVAADGCHDDAAGHHSVPASFSPPTHSTAGLAIKPGGWTALNPSTPCPYCQRSINTTSYRECVRHLTFWNKILLCSAQIHIESARGANKNESELTSLLFKRVVEDPVTSMVVLII